MGQTINYTEKKVMILYEKGAESENGGISFKTLSVFFLYDFIIKTVLIGRDAALSN